MLIACKCCTAHLCTCDTTKITSSYFIKDGAVSESGTHDELLSLKGGYYEYVQLQALSKK